MTAWAEINGTRTAYEVAGAGPPLLLIHGAEGGRRMFAPFAQALAPDFTVVTYDQRDCGETANEPRAATLEELASDAAALLQALGFAAALVYGTSFGGRVAQLLAIRRPDLVRGLILGSTWPLPLALPSLNPSGIARLMQLRAGLPATAAAFAEMFAPAAFLGEHPELADQLAGMTGDPERSARRRAVIADGSSAEVGAIAVPTLLIAGTLDQIVPPAVTLGMADRIAGARQVVLSDVGHTTTLQAPGEVAGHVRDFARSLDA
jgi:pimeloyl-ACP methyl ester carboxylesterase